MGEDAKSFENLDRHKFTRTFQIMGFNFSVIFGIGLLVFIPVPVIPARHVDVSLGLFARKQHTHGRLNGEKSSQRAPPFSLWMVGIYI